MQVAETDLRTAQVVRGEPFDVIVNGRRVLAYPGETVAAVLLAVGLRVFNHASDGSPRGLYCGIGRCFSCLVTVDGVSGIRACVTHVQPGMHVETGQALV